MAQAHVDPAALRRFARDLKRFNTQLQELVTAQQARLLELGRTWRDQENRKFTEQLEQTMKTLNRFLESSDQHVSFLTKKAGHIEDYLRQR